MKREEMEKKKKANGALHAFEQMSRMYEILKYLYDTTLVRQCNNLRVNMHLLFYTDSMCKEEIAHPGNRTPFSTMGGCYEPYTRCAC